MTNLPIIQNRKKWFIVSSIIVGVSIIAVIIFGFNLGIDFKGGTAWKMQFDEEVSVELLREVLEQQEQGEIFITRSSINENALTVRLSDITEERHQELAGIIMQEVGTMMELRFDSIGPAIGAELRQKAIWATILVLLGISLFVAYSFRKVSYPVSSWRYGIVTLVTLFHDVAITLGLLVLLGVMWQVEVDSNSVIAVLVVMGFSVHDTIVVFDRIRENIRLQASKIDFEAVVNKAVNDTIARSINTSITLVFVLLALQFFGPESLKFFLITLTVGVIAGTYSSIFVASPVLVAWNARGKKK